MFGGSPAARRRACWAAIVLSLLAAAGGWAAGSHALLAEGLRGASGSAASALRLGRLPSRPVPPGTRSVKFRGTGTAAALLPIAAAAVGIELVLSSFRSVWADAAAVPHRSVLIIIPLLWLMRAMLHGPGRIRIYEAYTSAAALLGAGLSWAGDRWGAVQLTVLDEAAGCAIGAAMALQGFRFVRQAVGSGRTAGVGEAQVAAMRAAAHRVDGVIEVGSCQTREQGHYVEVSLTIRVNPFITVHDGQEIGRRVRERLLELFPYVTDVLVKIEPYDHGYPYKVHGSARADSMPTLLQ